MRKIKRKPGEKFIESKKEEDSQTKENVVFDHQ
jgi:hypothetical protein